MRTRIPFEVRAKAHAERLAPNAIGKSFAVRIDKKTVTRGVITECAPWAIGDGSYGWKVTMLCGTAQAVRTFHVTRIPQ